MILTDPPNVIHYRDQQGRSVANDNNGRVGFGSVSHNPRLDGGYRRDHPQVLAQRIEVGDEEVRIMGSKSDLLRTLVAAQGGRSACPLGY